MTLSSKTQKLLTSNALIIPTAIVVGGLFWIVSMFRRNKEQV